MDLSDKQRQDVVDSVVEVFRSELGMFFAGVESDLDQFATKIAERIIEAAATGNAPLVGELRAQLRVLAEQHRLRASSSGWRIVEAIVPAVVKIAIGALRAVAL